MTMRHGNLALVETLPDRWRGNVVGLWQCDCGEQKKLPMIRVKSGHAKSCGCLKRKHGHAEHGQRQTREYVAWCAMRARCGATEGRDAAAYSERGISVCDRWSDFRLFLADMGPRPSSRHSLGRIDNDKGYEPSNCRWETPVQQQRNKRGSLHWHIRGLQFGSSREAGTHFGVNNKTISYWVKTGKDGCYVTPRY